MKILFWLTMIPTLLPFKFETSEGTVSYNTERVIRQLGYDQSVVIVTGDMGHQIFSLLRHNLCDKTKSNLCQIMNQYYDKVSWG